MDILKTGIDVDMRDMLGQMSQELEAEFERHVIPFWKLMRDKDRGGYYGKIGYDLKLDREADKGCILNSRILWTFSNLYLFSKKAEYRIYAKAAYDYLMEHFIDKVWGGVFWSVSFDGDPEDMTKHTYNLAFAIYALASYYDASGDREALVTAYTLFDVIEKQCRDEGGYLECFTRHFDAASNEKLSENGVMATRTMNTLLHVMEAYTELYRVDDIDIYQRRKYVREKLLPILTIFKEKVYNPDRSRLEVFFDADYNSLINLYSIGHDIEASWLLDRTVKILELEGSEYDMSEISRSLTNKVYDVAFTSNGMPAEYENGKLLETRIWWVQCEGIIGFLNEYQRQAEKTGGIHPDEDSFKYLNAALSLWNYIKKNMIDKRIGSEWYAETDAEGIPVLNKPIVDEWKCPYHNCRMYIEVMRRLGSYADNQEITEVLYAD
ncbi:mannobiose 2-epimerase [Lachnospiraceae bacterium NE2001]|nr:mannobiose 2-epimerase [Lachnospiraceae bacterium NE2001]